MSLSSASNKLLSVFEVQGYDRTIFLHQLRIFVKAVASLPVAVHAVTDARSRLRVTNPRSCYLYLFGVRDSEHSRSIRVTRRLLSRPPGHRAAVITTLFIPAMSYYWPALKRIPRTIFHSPWSDDQFRMKKNNQKKFLCRMRETHKRRNRNE